MTKKGSHRDRSNKLEKIGEELFMVIAILAVIIYLIK